MVIIINDKLKGRYVFHNKYISWSYLNLGKDVLIQINVNIIKIALKNNIDVKLKKNK